MVAPIGPGCYELRRADTGELVLFGIGRAVAFRMSSLMPSEFGAGRRNNTAKRDYVLKYLAQMEYRTLACELDEARAEELRLKRSLAHRFRT
ncbi:MAG: hypothetical protein NVV62_09635 [Terricaulis sp.]|nr:hypothetical protein [Terricaulis sp.]